MPRKYTRKTVKAAWSSQQLEAALQFVRNGGSQRQASSTFSIPRRTLQDRLKSGDSSGPSLGRPPVFKKEEEVVLAQQIIKLSKVFYGISAEEIKKCAFTYATKNSLNNPFSNEKESAGQDWLRGFLRRNPSIRLRKPEATSMNRATAFNRTEVTLFFSNLNILLDKHKFTASRVFNADETGITTVQVPAKIFAQKGQKRVGAITSAERGQTTTVMCCISASGSYVPPMFIYARKRMKIELQKNGPPGALYCCTKNGWINEDVFLDWLKHFRSFVKPSEDEPVLLILDNHSSHCTLQSYTYCKNNGIILLTIPPHTSHRLQPLDVSFYSSLKAAYNVECGNFLRKVAPLKITTSDIAEIFNNAFSRVATIQKAINGFRATGIFPPDANIFTDEDFAPAEALTGSNIEVGGKNGDAIQKEENAKRALELDEGDENGEKIEEEAQLTFSEIIPLPGCSKTNDTLTNKPQKNRKQHSEIFTSTPMKAVLEEKEQKKKNKEHKEKEKLEKKVNLQSQTKRIKRKIFDLDNPTSMDYSSTISNDMIVRKNIKRSCKQTVPQPEVQESSSEEEEDSDKEINEDICIICGEFGKNRELWIKCSQCGQWAHKACTDNDFGAFVCDFCA